MKITQARPPPPTTSSNPNAGRKRANSPAHVQIETSNKISLSVERRTSNTCNKHRRPTSAELFTIVVDFAPSHIRRPSHSAVQNQSLRRLQSPLSLSPTRRRQQNRNLRRHSHLPSQLEPLPSSTAVASSLLCHR
nr:hypothetical protein Iba_scaffold1393CG0660 [Ipomoea batatas]